MSHRLLVALACLSICGCGSSSPKPVEPANPDPVATFKSIVATGMHRAAEHKPHIDGPFDGQWIKWKTAISEPIIDVKKSDSLLMPYSGSIKVNRISSRSAEFPTKAEAEAATEFDELPVAFYELDYGFAEGHWVLKSVRYKWCNPLTGIYSGWTEQALDGEGVVAFFKP